MIGLCCQYLEPITKRDGSIQYKNIIGEKTLRYSDYLQGKYSEYKIRSVWINNATSLLIILQRINQEKIKLFRFSSNLFPLHSAEPELLQNNLVVKNALQTIGKFVKDNQMRLTTHPDQFVVLSSNNPDVIERSVEMLKHHAWIMDTMELPLTPYYAINIHGGAKGNANLLIKSINNLPNNVRFRLTLENDEVSYAVLDLLEISKQTNVPIVLDTHHHSINPAGLDVEVAMELCQKTWQTVKPLTHLSNSVPNAVSLKDRRKHSDYVYSIPDCQLRKNNSGEIDIEFEFKMKNIAIKKALTDFELIL